jgi:hypothetical protein
MTKERTIAWIALGALLNSACASGSRNLSPTTRASSGGAVRTTTVQATDDTSISGSTMQSQTARRDTVPSSTTATGASMATADESGQMLSQDEQIARWQARLAAAEQQFHASAGVCRGICRATDSICQAARELCALAGDREGAPPTDPRCARARASCERAVRQQREHCIVCSTE